MNFWRDRWEDFWEVPMVLHLITWAVWFGFGILVGAAVS